MKLPLEISSVNGSNPQFLADLVTFTEKILNRKLLCSEPFASILSIMFSKIHVMSLDLKF